MPQVNDITQKLQDEIKFTMTALMSAYKEAKDIYQVYWETDANTSITAVLLSTTPVTQVTKLTKGEFLNGITLVTNYVDFINNSATSTINRAQYCHDLIYGTATPTLLNSLIDSLGDRMKSLAEVFVYHYLNYIRLEKMYFSNEIGDMVGVLDAQRVIFGASMTQADLVSAITFLGEFRDFMSNAAVTTGDYLATLAKWELY